jgi:hypothetical protein
MGSINFWQQGERSRELAVCRPCACGCDTRLGVPGVGYLTGSDPDGNGFTLWIKEEAMYERLARTLRRMR